MKNKQVGYVLMALIILGVMSLIGKIVVSSSDELTLSGLLPITSDVIDGVIIESNDSTNKAKLVRPGDSQIWLIQNHEVFQPKLDIFWTLVAGFNGAQLVSTNPNNHSVLGVIDGQATEVTFLVGDFEQEKFLIGSWDSNTRLCYIRRLGKNDVHAIECPGKASEVFDPDPLRWRNPIIVAIPSNDIESVTFTYPAEEFMLKIEGNDIVVADANGQQFADLYRVEQIINLIGGLTSSDFADAQTVQDLTFDAPDAIIRIVTHEQASTPTTRVKFLKDSDGSYYVKTGSNPTVYSLNKEIAEALLVSSSDLVETEN